MLYTLNGIYTVYYTVWWYMQYNVIYSIMEYTVWWYIQYDDICSIMLYTV